MRLEKIKLNGFKSFAEPVGIDFASRMTGIVGPNGCGKSNLVDAVRWVMGESSRHIRATNLTEVIFSGSRTRQPMGQASIELVFDNSDVDVGSRFMQYSELSIKRTVVRDGESRYFINATRCRRQDIADVFFGTGLGVHSYAVIEQGMISRTVEAKPEEVRSYIEEAAGISQYKQRRRDAENRVRRTRENLDRVTDIVDEVSKQSTRLKRQVKSAEKFKQLRQDKERIESELLLLRYRHCEAECAACDRQAHDLSLDLEKARAALFEVEADAEKKRALASQRSDEIIRMKEEYYQLGARISGEEKDIETRRRSIERIFEEQVQVKGLIDRDKQAMSDRRAALVVQERRREEIDKETGQLGSEVERLVRESDAARQTLRETVQQSQSQADRLSEEISALREEVHAIMEQLHAEQDQRSGVQSRLASLRALQQAALHDSEDAVAQWLDAAGLKSKHRLAGRIRVADGWEQATEVVLGAFVAGFEVSSLAGYADRIGDFDRGTLALIETGDGDEQAITGGTLADKVSGSGGARALLSQVQLADDVPQALQQRASLLPGQSVITRDGVWIGANWMQLHLPDKGGEGVLLRERRMAALHSELGRLNAAIGNLQGDLEHRRTSLLEKEAEREGVQARIAMFLEGTTAPEGGTQEGSVQVLAEVSRQLQVARDALHRAEMERESVAGNCRAAQEQIAQLQSHLVELEHRGNSLDETLDELRSPIEAGGKQLEELLVRHVEEKEVLQRRSQELAGMQSDLQVLDRRRADLVEATETKRDSYEKARVSLQVAKARCKDAFDGLNQRGLAPEEVEAAMEAGVDMASHEEKLAQVQERIDRLGAINLVALEEFDELTERKRYLDAQTDDLKHALETLEDAIHKMDTRTRALFGKTFDDINANLQDIFPRLFGSGSAWLEMTDSDFFTAGVAVMVRMSGKRQVSINLLSGGEKAMTAIAVVFSIFALRPAPFCLLDEVDAPLDEHNIERFCELLKHMSEQVQFILITHNKTSMEYMDNLVGITMQEPGVSRLVSVDVESAAKLATA